MRTIIQCGKKLFEGRWHKNELKIYKKNYHIFFFFGNEKLFIQKKSEVDF